MCQRQGKRLLEERRPVVDERLAAEHQLVINKDAACRVFVRPAMRLLDLARDARDAVGKTDCEYSRRETYREVSQTALTSLSLSRNVESQ